MTTNPQRSAPSLELLIAWLVDELPDHELHALLVAAQLRQAVETSPAWSSTLSAFIQLGGNLRSLKGLDDLRGVRRDDTIIARALDQLARPADN